MELIKEKIFLIDGVGALLSALFLGLVLPVLEIGMPNELLYRLAIVAAIFSLYSLSCFYFKKSAISFWLKLIVIANALYCAATAFIAAKYFSELSLLGSVYFVGEILVIVALCGLELKIMKSGASR